MANPNRTAAKWRDSNPTFDLVEQISVSSQFHGELVAEEIKATKQFDRVSVASYAIGPRNRHQRAFVVRCYKRIQAQS